MRKAARFLVQALILTTMLSCGKDSKLFRMEGRFRNMNQAELYLFDTNHGWKDTIRVSNGSFAYQKAIEDTTLLLLMFPNYSELPIFARPGVELDVKGDASHLRETTVNGSDENEDMTDFRLDISEKAPPAILAEAEKFIRKNPNSEVSRYLLMRYFVLAPVPDYKKALDMASKISEARPQNRDAMNMVRSLEVLSNSSATQLPKFSATDINGSKVSNAQLRSPVNVVCLWTLASYDSKSQLQRLRTLRQKNPGKISVVSISIDANPSEVKRSLKRDSIDWPNVCDGKMWQSPVVETFGFATLPSNIIADKNGKILARNLKNTKELIDKIESLLPK